MTRIRSLSDRWSMSRSADDAADSTLSLPGRRFALSLRSRLILLVTLSVVPLLLFSLANEYLNYGEDRANAGQRTLGLARSMALIVAQELRTEVAAMQTLALSAGLHVNDIAAFRSGAEAVVAHRLVGADIVLLSKDGQQVMNTALPTGASLPKRPELDNLRQVFATGRPSVSHLYRSIALDRFVVPVDVPVMRANGSVAYVLSLNPPLDTFAEVIRRQQIPEGWVVSVFDQNGVIIARAPNAERFIGHAASPQLLPRLLAEREGIIDTTSLEGIPLLTAFSRAEPYGWSVGIGVPQAALTASSLRTALLTLAVGGSLLGLTLVLALLVARQITVPMAALSRLAATTDEASPIRLRPTGLREADEVAAALRVAAVRRQAAEATRKRAEDLFRQVVESAPNAMVMIDRDGKIELVNVEAERVFGYGRVELLGRRVEMLVPERFRSDHPGLRTAFFADPKTRRMGAGRDLYGVKKDGSEFPVEIGLNPIETENGMMVLAAIVDITERVRSEQELRDAAQELKRSNDELEHFAHVASHDLRAPLRAIKSLAEWIAEDIEKTASPETRENLALLQSRSERLETLLSGLLEYSRVGLNQAQPESVDTGRLVANIVEYLAPSPNFSVECRGDMPILRIAKAPLEHVFQNLISNALKHHDRDRGTVAISAQDLGRRVQFTVLDDGPGIDPAFHERIFGMFQTLRPRDEVEGSGVGLAIVKKAVETNGGSVTVASAPPRRGTAFIFSWRKTEQ